MKRNYADMRARCERQSVGFELLVLENIGGYYGNICKFLESLCRIADIEEYFPQIKNGRNYESVCLLIFKEIYMESIYNKTYAVRPAGWPFTRLGRPFWLPACRCFRADSLRLRLLLLLRGFPRNACAQ